MFSELRPLQVAPRRPLSLRHHDEPRVDCSLFTLEHPHPPPLSLSLSFSLNQSSWVLVDLSETVSCRIRFAFEKTANPGHR